MINEPLEACATESDAIHNERGLTIIELLISIAIGSLVIVMLMQMLIINIRTQRVVEFENMVIDQSFLIGERLQNGVFELQPHRVTDGGTAGGVTTIILTHAWEIADDGAGGVYRDTSQAVSEQLVFDSVAETLSYNGLLLHSTKIKILPQSSITVIDLPDIDPDYDAGIIVLDLYIQYEYETGYRSDIRQFITTIVV